MKYLIMIVLILTVIVSCDEQTDDKLFPMAKAQYVESVDLTDDGGCVVAGASAGDYFIMKINSLGEKEWSAAPGGDRSDWAKAVRQTNDGGFLVAGQAESKGIIDPDYYSTGNIWIVKYDSKGNQLWDADYGYSDANNPDEGFDGANSLELTSDGGFIVAGYTHNINNGDFYILKLDSDGFIIWEKTYGAEDTVQVAHSIKETPNGGFIVVGSTSSGDGEFDSLVIKLDENGNEIWSKTYGEVGIFDNLVDIQVTSDDGYIAVGSRQAGIFPGNDDDAWVIKMDSNGNIEWDNLYGGNLLDEINSVQQMGNDYVFAGSTRSYGQGNQYESDMWVVKLSSSGNELWSQTYGSDDNDVATELQITDASNIVVAGHSVNGLNVQDPYLLKLDADGNHN